MKTVFLSNHSVQSVWYQLMPFHFDDLRLYQKPTKCPKYSARKHLFVWIGSMSDELDVFFTVRFLYFFYSRTKWTLDVSTLTLWFRFNASIFMNYKTHNKRLIKENAQILSLNSDWFKFKASIFMKYKGLKNVLSLIIWKSSYLLCSFDFCIEQTLCSVRKHTVPETFFFFYD